jgi:hypothetical protein
MKISIIKEVCDKRINKGGTFHNHAITCYTIELEGTHYLHLYKSILN